MKRLVLALIHLYRYLASPWVGNQCRFHPTCSYYAEEAINHHGLIKGSLLAAKRLLKCHPWHPGGFDYVPGTEPEPQPGQGPQDPTTHTQRQH